MKFSEIPRNLCYNSCMVKIVRSPDELALVKERDELMLKELGKEINEGFDLLSSYEDFTVLGFYKDGELKGHSYGFRTVGKDIFCIAGFYLKDTFNLRYFINEIQDTLKDLGYTRWVSDYIRKDGKNDLAKYAGATAITCYYKDL